MPHSLWLHRLQHASLFCPSLSPRVCSNSYSLSQWCHSTVSSSVAPSPIALSLSQHQSFPMSWLFASGAKVLELQRQSFQKIQWISVNIQGWFPLGLTRLISLPSKGLWGVFSSTTDQKHQFFGIQSSWSNSHIVHDYRENHSFDSMDLCQQSDVSAF